MTRFFGLRSRGALVGLPLVIVCNTPARAEEPPLPVERSASAQASTEKAPASPEAASAAPVAEQSAEIASTELAVEPRSEEAELTTPGTVDAPELALGAPVSHSAPAGGRAVGWAAPGSDEEESEVWYGHKTLIVDGLGTAAIVGGLALEAPSLAGIGFVSYLLGAPIVHWVNGEVGTGFGSLGMRVASTAMLVFGGAACVSSALSSSEETLPCGIAILGVAAVPLSMVVDAAVLSYRTESNVALVPWVDRERRATGVSWLGRF